MDAKQIISKHGGKVVESYMLINNWGYVVEYHGTRYDVRRWANCYGSDIGWRADPLDYRKRYNKQFVASLNRDLNSYRLNTEW